MTSTEQSKPIPRTQEAIEARAKELLEGEQFLFTKVEAHRLIEALEWEAAEPYLKEFKTGHTEERWEAVRIKSFESVVSQIRDYLPFAWEKANGRRGTSAHRSLAHFRGLLWLLGNKQDELIEWIGNGQYLSDEDPPYFEYYGKPVLVKISEVVAFDWTEHDDKEWQPVHGGDWITREVALQRLSL